MWSRPGHSRRRASSTAQCFSNAAWRRRHLWRTRRPWPMSPTASTVLPEERKRRKSSATRRRRGTSIRSCSRSPPTRTPTALSWPSRESFWRRTELDRARKRPVLERLQVRMPRTLAFGASFALGFVATAGTAAFLAAGPQSGSHTAADGAHPPWVEMKWPFPPDVWSGKAFKCKSAECGVEVTLYLRAKIGFCNCTTGVADDEELERLADIDLIDGKSTAIGPGRPITVAWMKGRSRSYATAAGGPSGSSALLIAFNDRCDAIVGTAIVGQDRPAVAEQAVVDFLNRDVVLKWAQVTLGL